PSTFPQRWFESNARAIFLENIMLLDNDIARYPDSKSMYLGTLVIASGFVPATIICASMITVYQRVLYTVLYYALGLHGHTSRETPDYVRRTVIKEWIALAAAAAALVATWAQAATFVHLESGKSWSLGSVLLWTGLQGIGAAHSPVKPEYMIHGQISLWLALVNFACSLNLATAFGFLVSAAIRCWQTRDTICIIGLTDDEIRSVMAADNERTSIRYERALYHS
ncbi:hypothetical protein PFISCL1PPCAC_16616, partial [Pristionchus fissidentatus]